MQHARRFKIAQYQPLNYESIMNTKNIPNDKDRTKTRIAVYLIGMRGDTILLGKRKNTGHMDGCWSLVAGHVAEGESATRAIIREAEEECGIRLSSDELQLMGAMHHFSDPFDYVLFTYFVDLNSHQPENKEPLKCETLEFHSIHALPTPMNDYILEIIQKSIAGKIWVSEYGWKE